MDIVDLISFSFQSFKNRRSRVLLTVLGVAVGIGVVLFLVSLGYGLQKAILDQITTEESLLTLDVYSSEVENIELGDEAVVNMANIDGVETVSPQAVMSAQVNLGGVNSETSVNIVNEDFFALAGLSAEYGRVFSEDDQNEIVVGSAVASLFSIPSEEMLGKTMSLTFFLDQEEVIDDESRSGFGEGNAELLEIKNEFRVVGITGESEMLNEVYIKRADIPQIPIDEYQFVKVKVDNQGKLDSVRGELVEMGFLVSALSDIVDQANQVFMIIQIILGIFGVFSLFVAAIGLVNTMTISLLERVNEIGIMRAVGASGGDIKKIFLIESTLIGLLGGLGGILLGYLAGVVSNVGLNILARMMGGQSVDIFFTPLWFVLFIGLFSAFVGFIAGVFPARKASSLNALEALRYK